MRTKESGAQWLLLLAVFVIATCGLIYELVAGTLASYLLGDARYSVQHHYWRVSFLDGYRLFSQQIL